MREAKNYTPVAVKQRFYLSGRANQWLARKHEKPNERTCTKIVAGGDIQEPINANMNRRVPTSYSRQQLQPMIPRARA